jgi:hypothetical protein
MSSQWTLAIQNALMPNETLVAVVEGLQHKFYFVPHISPAENLAAAAPATLALTNRRIIAVIHDGSVWKWFSISAVNSLCERPLSQNKPSWPYQAQLMLPGGLGLVIQTSTNNPQHAKQLSTLLQQGFCMFGSRQDDGALAALVSYEEEQQRRQTANDIDN